MNFQSSIRLLFLLLSSQGMGTIGKLKLVKLELIKKKKGPKMEWNWSGCFSSRNGRISFLIGLFPFSEGIGISFGKIPSLLLAPIPVERKKKWRRRSRDPLPRDCIQSLIKIIHQLHASVWSRCQVWNNWIARQFQTRMWLFHNE